MRIGRPIFGNVLTRYAGTRLPRPASRRLVLIGFGEGSLLSFDEIFRYRWSP
jgi:hypothetical protein